MRENINLSQGLRLGVSSLQSVRDWSGILFCGDGDGGEVGAKKDIAESPTAEPERPKEKTTSQQDYKRIEN